jgi:hypothetical protein
VKRQNIDPSIPPAGAENLHFTLNVKMPRWLGKMQTRENN